MAHRHTDPAPSTAAIRSHPIHPMLIPFPLAFLVGVLLTDLAYWATSDPFWARASLWLVGAGVVSGLIAAAFGLVDFFTIRRARDHAIGWIHFLGNATALILSLVNWLLRFDDPAAAILPWGLLLSVIVAAILGVTGWAGGELSYRHRIGVMREPDSDLGGRL
ncbi:DUF2231 domain-containing protein [Virgifigura deserti]|uniref:DUF2231 domain-containing protein n=1 Tax=Virgifigura deserti TaxID=2268457 RepID=UPI003CCC1E45